MVDETGRGNASNTSDPTGSYEECSNSVSCGLGTDPGPDAEDLVYLLDFEPSYETAQVHQGHINVRQLPALVAGDGQQGGDEA